MSKELRRKLWNAKKKKRKAKQVCHVRTKSPYHKEQKEIKQFVEAVEENNDDECFIGNSPLGHVVSASGERNKVFY